MWSLLDPELTPTSSTDLNAKSNPKSYMDTNDTNAIIPRAPECRVKCNSKDRRSPEIFGQTPWNQPINSLIKQHVPEDRLTTPIKPTPWTVRYIKNTASQGIHPHQYTQKLKPCFTFCCIVKQTRFYIILRLRSSV